MSTLIPDMPISQADMIGRAQEGVVEVKLYHAPLSGRFFWRVYIWSKVYNVSSRSTPGSYDEVDAKDCTDRLIQRAAFKACAVRHGQDNGNAIDAAEAMNVATKLYRALKEEFLKAS
jgi:hypothetical protein